MNTGALLTLLMGKTPLSVPKKLTCPKFSILFIHLTSTHLTSLIYSCFILRHLKPVKGRKINWMKAAIIESDLVLTVSPYYAQELVSGEDRGVELDNIIRKNGISGIVNGMDNREWSPKTDKFIDMHFDTTTVSVIFPVIKHGLLNDMKLWTIFRN